MKGKRGAYQEAQQWDGMLLHGDAMNMHYLHGQMWLSGGCLENIIVSSIKEIHWTLKALHNNLSTSGTDLYYTAFSDSSASDQGIQMMRS